MDDPQKQADTQVATSDLEPATAPPPVEEPAQLGPLQRFSGTLFSPGETFKDVNRKPTFIAPILIGVITVLASTLFFNWRVHPDWARITRAQIQKRSERSGQQVSQEQIDQQVAIATKIQSFIPLLAAVFTPVVYLILAGVFALGMLFIQAQTSFKKILSIVTWSSAATGVVGVLVFIASLMVKDEASLRDLDPSQGANIVPSNIGAFLSSDVSAPLKALASSIDIFTIWFLILLTIGFAAISGAKKMSTSKTGKVVFGFWFIWVLLKMAFAAVFGGFGG